MCALTGFVIIRISLAATSWTSFEVVDLHTVCLIVLYCFSAATYGFLGRMWEDDYVLVVNLALCFV